MKHGLRVELDVENARRQCFPNLSVGLAEFLHVTLVIVNRNRFELFNPDVSLPFVDWKTLNKLLDFMHHERKSNSLATFNVNDTVEISDDVVGWRRARIIGESESAGFIVKLVKDESERVVDCSNIRKASEKSNFAPYFRAGFGATAVFNQSLSSTPLPSSARSAPLASSAPLAPSAPSSAPAVLPTVELFLPTSLRASTESEAFSVFCPPEEELPDISEVPDIPDVADMIVTDQERELIRKRERDLNPIPPFFIYTSKSKFVVFPPIPDGYHQCIGDCKDVLELCGDNFERDDLFATTFHPMCKDCSISKRLKDQEN